MTFEFIKFVNELGARAAAANTYIQLNIVGIQRQETLEFFIATIYAEQQALMYIITC